MQIRAKRQALQIVIAQLPLMTLPKEVQAEERKPLLEEQQLLFSPDPQVQGNPDYEPDDAKVPLNDNIVWVNKDTVPHTATSGTGGEDANSGKIFDTSIINGGEESSPLQLTGVKEGDEVPYYCQVHPYMTSKLTVGAASASGATAATGSTAGNASSAGGGSRSNATTTTSTTSTSGGNTSSTSEDTTSSAGSTAGNASSAGGGENATTSTTSPPATIARYPCSSSTYHPSRRIISKLTVVAPIVTDSTGSDTNSISADSKSKEVIATNTSNIVGNTTVNNNTQTSNTGNNTSDS